MTCNEINNAYFYLQRVTRLVNAPHVAILLSLSKASPGCYRLQAPLQPLKYTACAIAVRKWMNMVLHSAMYNHKIVQEIKK